MTRLSGTDDERAQEMERLAEDCARAWEVTELWKKRVSEVEGEAKAKLAEVRRAAHFTLERKEWLITRTGSCYHTSECSHIVRASNVKWLIPCAYCVPRVRFTRKFNVRQRTVGSSGFLSSTKAQTELEKTAPLVFNVGIWMPFSSQENEGRIEEAKSSEQISRSVCVKGTARSFEVSLSFLAFTCCRVCVLCSHVHTCACRIHLRIGLCFNLVQHVTLVRLRKRTSFVIVKRPVSVWTMEISQIEKCTLEARAMTNLLYWLTSFARPFVFVSEAAWCLIRVKEFLPKNLHLETWFVEHCVNDRVFVVFQVFFKPAN